MTLLTVAILIWVLILTLGFGVVVRQLVVLSAIINGTSRGQLESIGVGLGFPMADLLDRTMVADLEGNPATYFLFVSETCAPCRDLAVQMQRRLNELPRPLIVVATGASATDSSIRQRLPHTLPVVSGTEAAAMFGALDISVTPFLVVADASFRVGAKMTIRSVNDMLFAKSEIESGHVPTFNADEESRATAMDSEPILRDGYPEGEARAEGQS